MSTTEDPVRNMCPLSEPEMVEIPVEANHLIEAALRAVVRSGCILESKDGSPRKRLVESAPGVFTTVAVPTVVAPLVRPDAAEGIGS